MFVRSVSRSLIDSVQNDIAVVGAARLRHRGTDEGVRRYMSCSLHLHFLFS
jgi:hypothetical protein